MSITEIVKPKEIQDLEQQFKNSEFKNEKIERVFLVLTRITSNQVAIEIIKEALNSIISTSNEAEERGVAFRMLMKFVSSIQEFSQIINKNDIATSLMTILTYKRKPDLDKNALIRLLISKNDDVKSKNINSFFEWIALTE